jgi:hypothetical protein
VQDQALDPEVSFSPSNDSRGRDGEERLMAAEAALVVTEQGARAHKAAWGEEIVEDIFMCPTSERRQTMDA